MSYIKAGEILVRRGLITRRQLENVLTVQQCSPLRVGELVVELGYCTEAQVTQALADQYDMSVVDVQEVEPAAEALGLVESAFALRRQVLPLRIVAGVVEVAVSDPTDVLATDSLAQALQQPVRFILAPPTELRLAIRRAYKVHTQMLDLVEGGAPERPGSTQDDRAFLLLLVNEPTTLDDGPERKSA